MLKGGAERCFILALIVGLGSIPHVSRADAESAGTAKGAVILMGSSSINDSFGHLVASDLQHQGYKVVRRGYAAASLSRPDFIDLLAKASDLQIPEDTAGVLLYVGGNDAQALWLRPDERGDRRDAFVKWDDEAWAELYERRANDFVETLCRRGVPRVVLLPPADVVSPKMQRRLDRIRNLQARAAETSACGQYVPTGGDAALFAADAHLLRAPDGVHMTRTGAVRVWKRVATRVLAVLRS